MLPDIQRPFVWQSAKVRDLFDSMYKGFPVGYLLFWSNAHMTGAKRLGGDAAGAKIPNLLIVDGQQRLTSLYAVLKGVPVLRSDFSKSRIRIAFRPGDATFAVTDAAIERDPEFIPDISELWANGGPGYKFIKSFLQGLGRHRDIDQVEEDKLSSAIDRLYDLHNYPFTALEVSSDVNEEDIAEIFVRINSKGVTLQQADFILTLMSVFWEEGRVQLEEFCRQARVVSADPGKPSPFNWHFQPEPDALLRVCVGLAFHRARLQHVYSILRGKDLDTGDFSTERREKQFEALRVAQEATLNLVDWHNFVQCLNTAGFQSKTMITSENAVLYTYLLYLIGRHDYGLPARELKAPIAKWFFASALTARYTSSYESQVEEDLSRLCSATNGEQFLQNMNDTLSSTLTNDYWQQTLPAELETSAARTPVLSAYLAAQCILDAKALGSTLLVSKLLDPALKGGKAFIEKHHLFPKNYLAKLGIADVRDTNQVANFAYIEWTDNLNISDAAPCDYWPTLSGKIAPETARLNALPDNWHQRDYTTFLKERRKLMAAVIREGYDKLDSLS